jgi:hypothetical protein
MRPLAGSVVLAPLLLATTSVAIGAPHHKAVPKCSAGHPGVVATDAQAQVHTQRHLVRVPSKVGDEIFENRPETLGCVFGQRRSYDLGPAVYCLEGAYGPECSGVRREVLAGTIVAYEQVKTNCDPNCVWRVLVRDLRTGRLIHDDPTGTSTNPAYVEREGVGPARAIVVKSNGSVAWLNFADLSTQPPGSVYQVHVSDKTGSRLLASGTDIDPSSLALTGSTLYWTRAGKRFSAPLN